MPVINVGGIDAEVYVDGYHKGNDITGRGPWRQVVYRLPWDDSDAFMDALLGIGGTTGGPGGPTRYPSPHRYPGNTNIICLSVEASPVGPARADATRMVSFDGYAFVTALYGNGTWEALPDPRIAFGGEPVPFSRDTIRGFVEDYPLPSGGLTNEDGVAQAGRFRLRVPHQELIRQLYYIPQLEGYAYILESLVGRVNSTIFWGRAIGTVLFQDYDMDAERDTAGNVVETMTLRFVWRYHDWNKEPVLDNLNAVQWQYLKDANDIRPYSYVNLYNCFPESFGF
jgi:hypothetical protein